MVYLLESIDNIIMVIQNLMVVLVSCARSSREVVRHFVFDPGEVAKVFVLGSGTPSFSTCDYLGVDEPPVAMFAFAWLAKENEVSHKHDQCHLHKGMLACASAHVVVGMHKKSYIPVCN